MHSFHLFIVFDFCSLPTILNVYLLRFYWDDSSESDSDSDNFDYDSDGYGYRLNRDDSDSDR